MKKITLLILIIILISCYSFGQQLIPKVYAPAYSDDKSNKSSNYVPYADDVNKSLNKSFEYILNEGFDIWPPEDWTIINGSQSQGTQQWNQGSQGSNLFARIEWDDNGDGVDRPQDEWLISPLVTIPENSILYFIFTSNPYWVISPNNNADLRVLISDEGDTWVEIWNEEDYQSWEHGDWVEVFIDLTIYEGQEVQVAFQYIGQDACWWNVDDVQIYSIPEYNLIISDARMNFFEYEDYTQLGAGSYYHYSGHFGLLPVEQFNSEFALCFFNVAVENRGETTVTPEVNIKVFDPNDVEIFDETIVGTPLAYGEVDTLDFYPTPYFELGNDPELGLYTVVYTATILGEDIELSDNTHIADFRITENTFSTAGINVTERISPSQWVGGGSDGDMLGVTFTYLFEDVIESVDLFIHPQTDTDVGLIVHVMEFIEGVWTTISNSTFILIEEEHIGNWLNCEITGGGHIIEIEPGSDGKVLLVAVEFYYDGGNLYIGADDSNKQSFWSAQWYFQDDPGWRAISNWVGRGIHIRANTGASFEDPVEAENILPINNISIYPNPTTGILNIENVESASIEIFNLMGQSITRIDSANEFNTVDISNFANGTYIIRIVKDNKVHTHKINLID